MTSRERLPWSVVKHLTTAKGEMRRAIENVEVACGIPTLMQGTNLEDIATGIDEFMIRQPVGVCAAIAPFNFPGDDYLLVFTLCDCLWQHLHRQALRKSTAHDGKRCSNYLSRQGCLRVWLTSLMVDARL